MNMKKTMCSILAILLMTSTITFAYADGEEPCSLERAGGAKELSVTCYKQEEKTPADRHHAEWC